MTEKEFDKVIIGAINAAQEILHKSGITDKVVHQIGLAKVKDINAGITSADLVVEEFHKCKCWDCVNTNGGGCICCGPACDC
ncbi:MAG: hypothetical protein HWE39_10100 [Oceanospirillaceae bacterium]|nr:hypothetical protein [Oceanospirillaceae bacterium]